MSSPREHDLRTLFLHHVVVRKIRAEPALFGEVHERLKSQVARSDALRSASFMQWCELFAKGVDEALAAAIEDSDRGRVLRAASPFSNLLTEQEGLEFVRSWTLHQGALRCDS